MSDVNTCNADCAMDGKKGPKDEDHPEEQSSEGGDADCHANALEAAYPASLPSEQPRSLQAPRAE